MLDCLVSPPLNFASRNLVDGAQPQSMKNNKPDLSTKDVRDQQILDGLSWLIAKRLDCRMRESTLF
jgi:hypothetical protein